MDRNSLKVILENFIDSLNSSEQKDIKIEGPNLRKCGDNKYKAKITFLTNVNTDKKPFYFKLLDVDMKFDLNVVSDEDVIGSLEEAKIQLGKGILETVEMLHYGDSKSHKKQREYIC